jgi:hypothetical protein
VTWAAAGAPRFGAPVIRGVLTGVVLMRLGAERVVPVTPPVAFGTPFTLAACFFKSSADARFCSA